MFPEQLPYENSRTHPRSWLGLVLASTARFCGRTGLERWSYQAAAGQTPDFVLSGECPHCRKGAAFPYSVTSTHEDRDPADGLAKSLLVADGSLRCLQQVHFGNPEIRSPRGHPSSQLGLWHSHYPYRLAR